MSLYLSVVRILVGTLKQDGFQFFVAIFHDMSHLNAVLDPSVDIMKGS